MCVIGYVSSLPGICGLEEIQRWLWGFGEMLQFALGPCEASLPCLSRQDVEEVDFQKCIVPELLIILSPPPDSACYFASVSFSPRPSKVNITSTKPLALTLVWLISFLLLVAEHSSLILLVGGVRGTCLPLSGRLHIPSPWTWQIHPFAKALSIQC